MKIAAILLVALMSLSMISGTVVAADTKTDTAKAGIDTIKGKITSIDTVKNVIVVKERAIKTEKTIAVDPKVIATLKVGDIVKIESKTGSNVADSVKVIPPKK
jgi:hypothetical protein